MRYTYRMFYFLYRLCLKPEKRQNGNSVGGRGFVGMFGLAE
jgi:hypothetical protein